MVIVFIGSCESTFSIHFYLGSRDIYAGVTHDLWELNVTHWDFHVQYGKEFPRY